MTDEEGVLIGWIEPQQDLWGGPVPPQNFTFDSTFRLSNLISGLPNFALSNFSEHHKACEDVSRTRFETRRDSLGRGRCAGMKIKERVLRDQAALSGLQLGLMAAQHRLSLALIWMSNRRLVLPASLCALRASE